MIVGPPPLHRWRVTGVLVAIAVVLLPVNMARGREWNAWYMSRASAVMTDIDSGRSVDEVVSRHAPQLLPWSDEQMRQGIEMLRRAHVRPFDRLDAPISLDARPATTPTKAPR